MTCGDNIMPLVTTTLVRSLSVDHCPWIRFARGEITVRGSVSQKGGVRSLSVDPFHKKRDPTT